VSNPQRFAIDFAKMLKAAGDKAELVVKKSAFEVMNAVEEKSPVGDPTLWKDLSEYQDGWFKDVLAFSRQGYTGGRFRANWNLSIGSIDASTTEDIDKTGEATLARAQGKIEGYQMGDKVFITNSLPYAQRLEYEGWSSQAPAGMVRITAMEFEQYVREQAAKLK